jgi:uncharacterized membrane protein
MSTYEIFLAVHILAAVVWVGGAFVIQVLAFRILREAVPERMAAFAKDTEWVGMRFFLPASLTLLVFGFLLVNEAGWSLSDAWLIFALIVIAASIVTGAGFLGPEAGRLGKAIEQQGPASPEVRERLSRILLISRIELIFLIAVVVDMVAKPGS